MENWKKEKVSFAALARRLAALALAAALALGVCACAPAASAPAEPAPAPSVTQGEGLTAHFIDVGQALSVLVECEGHYLLYDGGNVPDGELVVSYLQNLGVQKLDYVFCSHAHEDHVGGLAAVLAAFPADHVYSPVTDATTVCFKNFVKYAQQQGRQVEIPAVGTSWPLGSATVQLLGPVRAYEDTNDTSLVLRIDYGQSSYLLTGDMEAEAERDLVDGGAPLDVDVLQVGHHGSNTSTSYVFLNQVLPEIAVISCGQGNEYGHPHEEPLSRLRDAGAGTYRTDLMGTIRVISDGAGYTIASQQFAEDQQLNPTLPEPPQQAYIGNVNSHKFHLPSCSGLPAEKNQILFSSYEEAVGAGYTPCGNCLG